MSTLNTPVWQGIRHLFSETDGSTAAHRKHFIKKKNYTLIVLMKTIFFSALGSSRRPPPPPPPPTSPSNVVAKKSTQFHPFCSKFNFVWGGRGRVACFSNITGKVQTLLTAGQNPPRLKRIIIILIVIVRAYPHEVTSNKSEKNYLKTVSWFIRKMRM